MTSWKNRQIASPNRGVFSIVMVVWTNKGTHLEMMASVPEKERHLFQASIFKGEHVSFTERVS